jgi:hypothetical protein
MFGLATLRSRLRVVLLSLVFVRTLYPSRDEPSRDAGRDGRAAAYALLNLFAPRSASLPTFSCPSKYSPLPARLYIRGRRRGRRGEAPRGGDFFCAGFAVFFASHLPRHTDREPRDGRISSSRTTAIPGGSSSRWGSSRCATSRGTFNTLDAATRTLKQTNDALARFVPNDFLATSDGSRSPSEPRRQHLEDMCVMFVHLGIDAPMQEAEERLNLLEAFKRDPAARESPHSRARGSWISTLPRA